MAYEQYKERIKNLQPETIDYSNYINNPVAPA